jgi:hypothetical protein
MVTGSLNCSSRPLFERIVLYLSSMQKGSSLGYRIEIKQFVIETTIQGRPITFKLPNDWHNFPIHTGNPALVTNFSL